jgi:hypothetical protein
MSGLGRPADKRLRLCRCPKGAAASREGSGINQVPGEERGRLRLCRCPKGAAASREGSGINASGEAEAKQASSKCRSTLGEQASSNLKRDHGKVE